MRYTSFILLEKVITIGLSFCLLVTTPFIEKMVGTVWTKEEGWRVRDREGENRSVERQARYREIENESTERERVGNTCRGCDRR